MTHTGLGFPAHKLKCVVYPFTPLTLITREALLPTFGIRQTDFTSWLLRMILRFRRHITLQLTLKRGALRFYMESDGEATNPRPDASTTGQWNSSGGGANSYIVTLGFTMALPSSRVWLPCAGAGALFHRERMRKERRGGKEWREPSEKSMQSMNKRVSVADSVSNVQGLGWEWFIERGTLRYDEVSLWLAIVLWFGMWPLW